MPSPPIVRTRLISWPMLGVAMALYLAINFLVVFVLFPSGVLRVFARPTGGLVSATWMANIVLLVVVVGVLRWRGGLHAVDLGLGTRGLLSGVVVTISLWAGLNAFQVLSAVNMHTLVEANPDWAQLGVLRIVGAFLAQLLGNALFEEILFRGVLFEQLRVRFLDRGMRPAKSLLLALLISQALFALIHVPLRLSSGMPIDALPSELALLFGLGVLLALLYWRTANLYVCVGVHALSNAPLLLAKQQVDVSSSGMTAAVAAVIVLLLWPRWRARRVRAEAQSRG